MKNLKTDSNINFTKPHLLSGYDADTPILLALSGGADSRALLDMLVEYCREVGAPLSVAHVNHMIRGKDAERDRDFCAELAKKHSLPFYLLEADVPALAKEHGRGLEEEARIVRYEFFSKIMRENAISILATAHNATDNAETVIFNIARGSGLKGLCGIPPVRDFEGGRIIRPLLLTSKDDILKYCEAKGLRYVTDSTNSDVEYSRNRIRNNIIPELVKINGNAIANIGRMSGFARDDDGFLDSSAQNFINSLKDKHELPLDSFLSLDKAIASRVLSILLGDFFEVSAVHVASVTELARKGVPHSMLNLPQGVSVAVENQKLCFTDKPMLTPSANFDMRISFGETRFDGLDMAVLTESTENSEENHIRLKNIYKNSTTTYISSDKINDGLFIRTRHEGDKILSGGMHKKLKKLFCEKKIPIDLRTKLPIFYDGKGILWVPLVALRDGENNTDKKIQITLFYN